MSYLTLFVRSIRFTMANVSAGSPRLWGHAIGAYLLTSIVIRELLVEYNAYNNIRHRYLLSREFHLRTVLVTNIPRHLRAPSKITTYFKNVYPDAVKSVTICQNLIYLESLIAKRTRILGAIEKELLVLCREEKRNLVMNLGTLTRAKNNIWTLSKRLAIFCGCYEAPQERLAWLYGKLEEVNESITGEQARRKKIMSIMDKLDTSQGGHDIDFTLASKATFTENSDNARPKPLHAKGAIKRYSKELKARNFLGRLRNQTDKKDTTGFIENHINEVTDKAFVIMRTFTASTIAIQSMHSSKPGSMQVATAPEPRDVLWSNVYVSKGARKTRTLIADLVCLFIISFYIIPVTIISLLVSENALVSYSPRIAQLDKASALFSSAIALVQPLCLVGVQQLLPPIFIFIGKSEGILSFSEVQMKAFSRYFMFQVLNIFLVTSIAGSIFDTLAIIIDNPESALLMLGNSLPRMSSFFITLTTMKTFLGLGFELVRAASMLQSMLRLIFCPLSTLRQRRSIRCGCRSIDDPGWFPIHKILAQDMLVVVISVVFSVIAPIVLFPCAIFCFVSRLMWTHHQLYVFESTFETGGLFWPKIFRRFIFGLIVAQATITGQFILKEAPHQAYATIALIFITYFFLRSTRARYDHTTFTLPLEVATCMVRILIDIFVFHTLYLLFLKSQQDISVSEEEEKRRLAGNQSSDFRVGNNEDPWDKAYMQPALRACPRARPEQPFPPAQLGKVESLFTCDKADRTGTVKLNKLGHSERVAINEFWKEQVLKAGKQNLLSVLIGDECGTLRIGIQSYSESTKKRRENSSELNSFEPGDVEVIPGVGVMV